MDTSLRLFSSEFDDVKPQSTQSYGFDVTAFGSLWREQERLTFNVVKFYWMISDH